MREKYSFDGITHRDGQQREEDYRLRQWHWGKAARSLVSFAGGTVLARCLREGLATSITRGCAELDTCTETDGILCVFPAPMQFFVAVRQVWIRRRELPGSHIPIYSRTTDNQSCQQDWRHRHQGTYIRCFGLARACA